MTCLSGAQISSHLSRFISDKSPPKIESFVERIVATKRPWATRRPRDGYEPPVVRLVIVDPDQLTLNGEVTDRPTLFFVGKMFVLKDSLKDLFSVRYGDIEFGGRINAAWYVHITDGAEETIASWLRSMGWRVEIDDLRDEPNDDE